MIRAMMGADDMHLFSRELRVLAALCRVLPCAHGDVPKVARMDISTAHLALRRLLARGWVAVEQQRRGPGGGSGPPRNVWTRTEAGDAALRAVARLREARKEQAA